MEIKKMIIVKKAHNPIWRKKIKQQLNDIEKTKDRSVCIIAKNGLQKVIKELTRNRSRFISKCKKNRDAGKRTVFLIQEEEIVDILDVENWLNPDFVSWCKKICKQKEKNRCSKWFEQPPLNGERLLRAMLSITDRYGVEWNFCSKNEIGIAIKRVLE